MQSALQAADGAPPARQSVKGTFRHPPRLHGVRAAIEGGAGEEDDDDNCGVAGHGHADSAKAPLPGSFADEEMGDTLRCKFRH